MRQRLLAILPAVALVVASGPVRAEGANADALPDAIASRPALSHVPAQAAAGDAGVGLALARARSKGDAPDPERAALVLPLLPEAAAQTADTPTPPPPLRPRYDWHGGETFTRTLAAELARASAQGLLEPNGNVLEASPDATRLDIGPIADGLSLGDATVRIRTGVDRAFDRTSRSVPRERALTACLPSETMDLTSWGGEGEPVDNIAKLRSTLLGEFDKPDPYAVSALARLFVYLSFGAEAQQLLDAFPTGGDDEALIRELARVMDGEEVPGGVLTGQTACGGFAALWGLLAAGGAGDGALRVEDILFSFSALPPHLRRHLAPRLADLLTAAGETDAIDVLVASVARIAPAGDPALVLTQARGPASALTPASEDDGLMRLARTVHPEASMALLLQIEELVTEGRRVPEDLVDTAAILSFERQGTTDGARLKAAEIAARTANGELLPAYGELAKAAESGVLVDELLARGRDRVFAAAVKKDAADAVFARIVFDPRSDGLLQGASEELLRSIADRLVALGFGDRAASLAPPGDATDGVFLARVALAEGDAEGALDHADASAEPAAVPLGAEALSRLDRHDEAATLLRDIGDAAGATDEAWRAGDWARVASGDTSVRGRAAALMTGLERDPFPPEPPSTSLARSTRLIEDSAALRQTLDELLATVGVAGG